MADPYCCYSKFCASGDFFISKSGIGVKICSNLKVPASETSNFLSLKQMVTLKSQNLSLQFCSFFIVLFVQNTQKRLSNLRKNYTKFLANFKFCLMSFVPKIAVIVVKIGASMDLRQSLRLFSTCS